MTISLLSQECRQIFQCHLYMLKCFTAIYFFQYIYSSGLSSFSPERTLKNTPLFIICVVHATTNIKDILLISYFFATIVFSQCPLWKKNFKNLPCYLHSTLQLQEDVFFRECYHIFPLYFPSGWYRRAEAFI